MAELIAARVSESSTLGKDFSLISLRRFAPFSWHPNLACSRKKHRKPKTTAMFFPESTSDSSKGRPSLVSTSSPGSQNG